MSGSRWELPIPERMSIRAADIYLVGFGMRVPNDLTLEALLVLARSRKILAAPPPGIDLGFKSMIDLSVLYSPKKSRQVTYRDMVDATIEAARQAPPVTFLTYGSAMFGVSPAHMILAEGPRHGLIVHVCNGVSALEGIWSSMNIEPCDGFTVWEASAFVMRGVVPSPESDILLVQAPFFGILEGAEAGQAMPAGNLTLLRDYLVDLYGASHEVAYVRAEAFSAPAVIHRFPLGELALVEPVDGSSLYIPRAQQAVR